MQEQQRWAGSTVPNVDRDVSGRDPLVVEVLEHGLRLPVPVGVALSAAGTRPPRRAMGSRGRRVRGGGGVMEPSARPAAGTRPRRRDRQPLAAALAPARPPWPPLQLAL